MYVTTAPLSRFSQVLKVHVSGYPIDWVSHEEAARLIANGSVAFSFGQSLEETMVLNGGKSSLTGITSTLSIPPIIAVDAREGTKAVLSRDKITIWDKIIFRRDGMTCAYCGARVKEIKISKVPKNEVNKYRRIRASKDHIIPKSWGGPDSWENLITSCEPCNNYKANRTPEQAGMKLLYKAFRPNRFEYLALTNSHLTKGQLEYLEKRFRRQV